MRTQTDSAEFIYNMKALQLEQHKASVAAAIAAATEMFEASGSEELCPICVEPLSEKGETQNFFPCPCNYRVCMFCVRRLSTEFDNRCPGCRRDYDEKSFRFEDKPLDKPRKSGKRGKVGVKGEMQQQPQQGGQSSIVNSGMQPHRVGHVRQASTGSEGVAAPGGGMANITHPSQLNDEMRRKLANVRVVQRNLVYLVGLAPSIAQEETLRSNSFFGQYGKIIKVAIARNDDSNSGNSAYITYAREEDAKSAIKSVHGFWVDKFMIKASFGTTKYCNMFLRGMSCSNPDCLYLHKLGDGASSFTKEEMQVGNNAGFQDMTQLQQQQQEQKRRQQQQQQSANDKHQIAREMARTQAIAKGEDPDVAAAAAVAALDTAGDDSFGAHFPPTSAWSNSGSNGASAASSTGQTPGIAGLGAGPTPSGAAGAPTPTSTAGGWAGVAAGNSAAAAVPPTDLIASGGAVSATAPPGLGFGGAAPSQTMEPIVPKKQKAAVTVAAPASNFAVKATGIPKPPTPPPGLNIPIVNAASSALLELRSASMTLDDYKAAFPSAKPAQHRAPGPPGSKPHVGPEAAKRTGPDAMMAEVERGIQQLKHGMQGMKQQQYLQRQKLVQMQHLQEQQQQRQQQPLKSEAQPQWGQQRQQNLAQPQQQQQQQQQAVFGGNNF